MSFTGQEYPNQSAPGFRDPRALSEEEWRASLPSFGQQLGTGLGQASSGAVRTEAAPSVAPFSTQDRLRSWRATPTTSNTPWVWWLIATPILGGLAMWPIVFTVFGFENVFLLLASDNDPAALRLVGFFFCMGLAIAAVTMLLGFGDRAALRRLGHSRTASPWWQLLSQLVYLIVRTVHANSQTGRGAAPLVVYLCLQIAPVVLGVIAAVAIPAFIAASSTP